MGQKKGYKFTEEHRRNLSRARGGYKHTDEARKKMSESQRRRSEETRRRISESLKGKKLSEEHKQKIGEAGMGRTHTEESKMKMRLNHVGFLGKKHSKEAKGKMIKKLKGIIFSEEHKRKMSLARKNQILPKRDTSIEVKVQNFLKQLEIEFFTHQHMKEIEHSYQCDIFIPSMNLVIECDGNYWHKYPVGNELDHIRTSELLQKGFKVLRLWEFQINEMTIDKFKEKLNDETY